MLVQLHSFIFVFQRCSYTNVGSALSVFCMAFSLIFLKTHSLFHIFSLGSFHSYLIFPLLCFQSYLFSLGLLVIPEMTLSFSLMYFLRLFCIFRKHSAAAFGQLPSLIL